MNAARIALALALLTLPALAGTRYVDAGLTTGLNDGTSWADAHRGPQGLQAALTASVAGDEIWVADGLYTPSAATRTVSFQLKNGVTIYGGFAGGEASVAERNPLLNVAILSGDLAGNDTSLVFTDNSYHVLNGNSTNATAVIDGFTVTGGNANGAANDDRGGGILCTVGAGPTVRRCLFLANRCTFGGGAGYLNSSSPSFSDCTFESNQGGSFGGAFDMATSVGATFDRCVFRNNRAARAGAIEIFGSSPVKVYNSLFIANQCTGTGGGGAIYVSSSAAQIRNCTVIGNSATVTAAGGLLVSGGSPTVTNCIFSGNFGTAGNTVGAQVSAGVTVTYTLMPFAYAGTGNLNATPVFAPCGLLPYRLAPTSPGVDAGNNAGLPAGTNADLSGFPRFVDVPTVANTGAGTAPIVDMGCMETDVDCNGNGIPDPCDITSGASLDVNANRVPDECECQGGVTPTAYCTSKLNSLFCTPLIGFSGYASASNNAGFVITAASIINQKSGLLFYGYMSANTPFLGGTLCIASPIRRTATQLSGGATTGTNCTGSYTFDFNAFIASGADPLLQTVGQTVRAQWWSRDPQDQYTTSLTNALQFAICQ
ncbi:MAG: right-handed parallel beta-helix repeat-containing protein [Planctomycetes bacterium]|nr:right-handed parallel beta-helix repeat-containing protein [Planctomycetota bacterium]